MGNCSVFQDLLLKEVEFLTHFSANSPQLMWFLGAGTSRTAGMPTATDITWDLKRKYYCREENQDLQSHDINNQAIRDKIQSYLGSKGFPALWSSEEYSFYFELLFGADYGAQQRYIQSQLSSQKISLNIGHRILAALLDMGQARVIFTTNFDEVIETAYSHVAEKSLAPFHLEGSYAALNGLNAEQFPIYAKIHGDFRYISIKNLAKDLIENDQEIQKCFLAAANRYGLVVSGYSGRDKNVMGIFYKALEQNNPFPQGLFWTVPRISEVAESVVGLITAAQEKGVKAYIVETGTFDIMLSKIWRQTTNKSKQLDLKVCSTKTTLVSIPMPIAGKSFPILRTNALPVIELPKNYNVAEHKASITYKEVNDNLFEHKPNAVIAYTDKLLFWGDATEIYKAFGEGNVESIQPQTFDNPVKSITESTFIHAFFEHALARSLCEGKPIQLRRKNRTYYAVVDRERVSSPVLQPLKDALSFRGKPGYIAGSVSGVRDAIWAEALSLKLEERDGKVWLLIRPDIWVTPLRSRVSAIDFLRNKKRYRYNPQSSQLLDAWIRILFGSIGADEDVQISCFVGSENAPLFKINTRTAYSRGGVL